MALKSCPMGLEFFEEQLSYIRNILMGPRRLGVLLTSKVNSAYNTTPPPKSLAQACNEMILSNMNYSLTPYKKPQTSYSWARSVFKNWLEKMKLLYNDTIPMPAHKHNIPYIIGFRTHYSLCDRGGNLSCT
jgi:hypothetical protein